MNTLTDTVVPTWIPVALGAAMLLGVVLLALRAKKANATTDPTIKQQKALRRLFLAAIVPTLTVIAAVMGISFIGLSSFARHDMGWDSAISLIVPLSLDGISITFGFWAFVAVKRGRHPGRSEKIVYVGAMISAWINFNHGRQEWTGAAGIYLGFLSIAAAWMFHELLSQFMDAHEHLPKARRNGTPIFGERWMWAPWSTLMARRAWVVYPPTPDVEPTAANALAHLQQTRRPNKRRTATTANAASARKPSTPRTATNKTAAAKAPAKPRSRKTDATTVVPPVELTPVTPDPTPTVSVPTVAAITSPAPVTPPPSPAPTAAASATDTLVAPADAARLKVPVPASLLTRARYLADAHRQTEGTPITAGKLAVDMHVNSEVARQLLDVLALDPARVTEPVTLVNGKPVGVLR